MGKTPSVARKSSDSQGSSLKSSLLRNYEYTQTSVKLGSPAKGGDVSSQLSPQKPKGRGKRGCEEGLLPSPRKQKNAPNCYYATAASNKLSTVTKAPNKTSAKASPRLSTFNSARPIESDPYTSLCLDTDLTVLIAPSMARQGKRQSYKQIVTAKNPTQTKQNKQSFKKTLSARNLSSNGLIQDNRAKVT